MPLGTDEYLGPGHIVLDVDLAPPTERGTAPPLFSPCLLCPKSPVSATAKLFFELFKLFNPQRQWSKTFFVV